MIQMTVGQASVSGNFFVAVNTWGGFAIETIKSMNAPSSAVFLPTCVSKDNVRIWSFKTNHPGYRGLAKLEEIGDELVIVLCTKQQLDMVIPVADLPSLVWLKTGGFIGGRDIKVLIDMKQALADQLGLEPVWTKREETMRKEMVAEVQSARRDQILSAETARKEKAEAARRARDILRATIANRKRLHVFTEAGEPRNGHPVIDGEWQALVDGKFCVLVESFDSATGKCGKVIESFVTKKNKASGSIEKYATAAVMLDNPKPVTLTPTVDLDNFNFTVVPVKGVKVEAVKVGSIGEVRQLRDKGINGGTYVTAPEAEGSERWVVYQLSAGEIITVTTLRLVNRATSA